jgi:hypothetical protein
MRRCRDQILSLQDTVAGDSEIKQGFTSMPSAARRQSLGPKGSPLMMPMEAGPPRWALAPMRDLVLPQGGTTAIGLEWRLTRPQTPNAPRPL